jgi:PPOX class probable F420-dependent enzyme
MPHELSDEEIRAFLLRGTRTAKIATVMKDGGPHVMPVWFVLDGRDVLFTTHEASLKARNLRRDPRVALAVDDEAPPYAFVHIRGRASLSEAPAELLRAATEIGARYMGADRAEEFGRRNGVPGELVVRVTPERVIAQGDLTGY